MEAYDRFEVLFTDVVAPRIESEGGKAVPESQKAVELLERAQTEGAYSLGLAYLHGIGTEKNIAEALRLLDFAAAHRLAAAAEAIEDIPDAIKAQAAFVLAAGCDGEENAAEAARWFGVAAEAGHGEAMLRLGSLYAAGKGDVPCNREAARYWCGRAAKSTEDGIAEKAQKLFTVLGELDAIDKNRHAIEILERAVASRDAGDYTRALPLLHEALEWAVRPETKAFAEYELAYLYDNGLGVPEDGGQALFWLRRAAADGHEEAAQKLKETGTAEERG